MCHSRKYLLPSGAAFRVPPLSVEAVHIWGHLDIVSVTGAGGGATVSLVLTSLSALVSDR